MIETFVLFELYEGSPPIGTYVTFDNRQYVSGFQGISRQEAKQKWRQIVPNLLFSLEEVSKIVNNWSTVKLTPKEIEIWADNNL